MSKPIHKSNLHPRNKHRKGYNFDFLSKRLPELSPYVHLNNYGNLSIDFANPKAVKALNKALLLHHYQLAYWDIPPGYLCPPVPGRADYIHYIADWLARNNEGEIPIGPKVNCLDIGMGANCIYPIIGVASYGWNFVGTDINPKGIASANKIIANNPTLKGKITCRLQKEAKNMFKGIIREEDHFDMVICNPPFHASPEAAASGTRRKLKNLKRENVKKLKLNFGGQAKELWCEGGELQFIKTMILESVDYSGQIDFFSTLVSKKDHLHAIYKALKKANAKESITIEMGQGNKLSRIVIWKM